MCESIQSVMVLLGATPEIFIQSMAGRWKFRIIYMNPMAHSHVDRELPQIGRAHV